MKLNFLAQQLKFSAQAIQFFKRAFQTYRLITNMSSSVLLKHDVRNGKSVAIKLSTDGPGYKRLVDVIGDKAKDNAATTVAAALEKGIAVKDEDYATFDEVKINNMNHESATDPNAHFSCEIWSGGEKVKGFHVMQDPSKQTRAN